MGFGIGPSELARPVVKVFVFEARLTRRQPEVDIKLGSVLLFNLVTVRATGRRGRS